MRYPEIVEAVFLNRPNRFIALCSVNGAIVTVHVKNTGRCRELLIPGSKVFLSVAANKNRKTDYDLVCVEKKISNGKTVLINIDSQIPNDVAAEYLPVSGIFNENSIFKREVIEGNSRFDFCIYEPDGKKSFLEVKGVTLEIDGDVFFPDAPTARGLRHVRELEKLTLSGVGAYILFIVQMKTNGIFRPNFRTDPDFGNALAKAERSGVKVICVDCNVLPDCITVSGPLEIELSERTEI